MRTTLSLLLILSVSGALGCEPDTVIEYNYAPFAGEVYPSLRPPVAVPAGGMGIVTNSFSDSLSLIDLGSGEPFATFPVGRDPVGVDGPHHVAVDPHGGFLYVALSYPVLAATGPHAAHGSSVQPGYAQKLSLSDFQVLGQVRVDNNPGDIVLSGDGKRLVVSHFDLQKSLMNPGNLDAARATLAVLDPSTIAPAGSPMPARISVCVAPHGVVLSEPDEATAYVACYGEDAVAVVDLAAGKVLDRIPVGAAAGSPGDPTYGPYSAVLSPDGKTIAIGCTVSKDVRFFDVATKTVDPQRTLATDGAAFFPGWTADGARLYVPTQSPDALLLIDVSQGNLEINRRDFAPGECPAPHVASLRGSDSVLLVCEGDHVEPGRVLTLDATTLKTVKDTPVGIYPDALTQIEGTP